ncbi:UNVERIFIED_CONTAM: hypothetical protein Slati_2214300 [Sesamum latifolium]|uniref:Endonuclease/exonuclease/phosphatase domain-containing protein n=1 Tax=Sesamum latifolium TaxID=2727402 RepID=A0AAW2WVY0_9LAMI
MGDAPWLYGGDFNEIDKGAEAMWQIEDFRRALNRSNLNDLGFRGVRYTWCSRRQAPETIWPRLDRTCGNTLWHERHPDTLVTHKPVQYSDHVMLCIQWMEGGALRG